jgi:pyridoxal phosphate enzyme (YggS family)
VDDITLIAVTKTYPVSDVEILHSLGQRNFGENRSEEGAEKSAQVDGTWHYQGQVQSRKLRDIAGWASYIHSIDSSDHALKLSRICEELGKDISIFIQLSLDGAPERGGVIATEIIALAEKIAVLPNIKLAGLMCVPPVTYEHQRAFTEIAQIHQSFIGSFSQAKSLSAGMSSDFEVAIAHGATHLRIGSQILGSRTYHP